MDDHLTIECKRVVEITFYPLHRNDVPCTLKVFCLGIEIHVLYMSTARQASVTGGRYRQRGPSIAKHQSSIN